MISLTEKFQTCFSPAAQTAGAALTRNGGLTLLRSSSEAVQGEWYEGEGGECSLTVAKPRLLPKCDCADFKSGHLCCHLWSLLMLAERAHDLSEALKRSVSPILESQPSSAPIRGLSFYTKKSQLPPPPPPESDSELHYEPLAQPRFRTRPVTEPPPQLPPNELRYEPLARPTTGFGRWQTSPARQDSKARQRKAQALQISSTLEQGSILFVLRCDEQPDDSSHLRLETWQRQTGNDGKRHCFPTSPAEISVLPDEATKSLLATLLMFGKPYQRPDGELRANGLEIAVSHLVMMSKGLDQTDALRWLNPAEQPARFHKLHLLLLSKGNMEISAETATSGFYTLGGQITCGQSFYDLSEVQYASSSGWLIADDTLILLAVSRQANFLREQNLSAKLNTAALKSCLKHACTHYGLSLANIPSSLHPPTTECKPKGVLYVQAAPFKDKGHEQVDVELWFDYGSAGRCRANDDTTCLADDMSDAIVLRNPSEEQQLTERLRQLGFTRPPRWSGREWQLVPSLLDDVVRTLVNENWLVTAQGKSYVRPVTRPMQIKKSDNDWFELTAKIEYNGQEYSFPKLLQAASRGQKTVILDDGSEGLLPVEWLENCTALTEFGKADGDKMIFRVQQAAILEALLKGRLEDLDGELARVNESLRKFATPRPMKSPDGFKATLRPYQEDGFGWLVGMCASGLGVCLADDMGLGKTVQVLALLRQRQLDGNKRPTLIVMPKSLLGNWTEETRKFAPSLRTQCYTGPGRSLHDAQNGTIDLLFTTYGTMRMDAEALSAVHFDYCILDESQAIKNVESSTAKAARTLHADHRLAMTGTPIENSLAELFSQLEFLNPGLCGRESGVLKLSDAAGKLSGEKLETLRRNLRPFLLRRRKEDVATDLPAKTEQVIFCEMDDSQQRYYDELRNYYRQKFAEKEMSGQKSLSSVDMLSALMRLRQAACHPKLINQEEAHCESAKMDVLLDQLEEILAGGHKALIFSQFTGFLQMVASEFEKRSWKYNYLDGQTRNRMELVDDFQHNPDTCLFLISLKAGGVGLNLTAADYVFILDPWWNPATEAQAIDRAYRIGQKRAVFAYRLITRGTVEEKVMNMQQEKKNAAAAVLDGVPGSGTQLTQEDIAFLLND